MKFKTGSDIAGGKLPVLPLPSPGINKKTKTEPKKSGTALMSSPAKASSAAPVAAPAKQSAPKASNLYQWMMNVDALGKELSEDYTARNGVYQPNFSAYRTEKEDKISELAQNGAELFAELEQKRAQLSPEEYDVIAQGVGSYARYLAGARAGLSREEEYYATFANEADFVEKTKGKKPVDAIDRQMQAIALSAGNVQNKAIPGRNILAPGQLSDGRPAGSAAEEKKSIDRRGLMLENDAREKYYAALNAFAKAKDDVSLNVGNWRRAITETENVGSDAVVSGWHADQFVIMNDELQKRGLLQPGERVTRKNMDRLFERYANMTLAPFQKDTDRTRREYQIATGMADMAENAWSHQLMNRPGFEQKAAFRTRQRNGEYANSADALYDMVNQVPGAKEAYISLSEKEEIAGNRTHRTEDAVIDHAAAAKKIADQVATMTQEEREIFNYLFLPENPEEALAYLDTFERRRTAANREQSQEWIRDAVNQPGAAGAFSTAGLNLLTVLAIPMKLSSVVGNTVSLLSGEPIDPNAGYNAVSAFSQDVRSETSRMILEGDSNNGWRQLGNWGYQTAMSMADFLYTAAITGGFGGTAFSAPAAKALSLSVMGTSAAADATTAALDQGMDSNRAYILGMIAGGAEILTEMVSLETLLDPKRLTDSGFKYWIKNVLAEGAEEGASDAVNWLADGLYDVISGQSESAWKRAIREYEEQGKSAKEAFSLAVADRARDLSLSMLGGAFSGAVMAGSAVGLDYTTDTAIGKDLARKNGGVRAAMNNELRRGTRFSPDSDAYRMAQGNLERIAENDFTTRQEIRAAGRQYRVNEMEQTQPEPSRVLPLPAPGIEKTASGTETADSTIIDTNPVGHTPAENRLISEYRQSTDKKVLEYLKKWRLLQNPNYKKKAAISLGDVSDRAVRDIEGLLGIDVSGYEHSFGGNAVQHIENRHGKNGQQDHTMADDNDIARMGYVLDNYDGVETLRDENGKQVYSREFQSKDRRGAPLVRFSKRVDGTYYIVEAVPDANAKKLRVVSAYMQKKSESTDQMLNMEHSSLQPTSETPNGAHAFTKNSIPATAEKSQGEKSPVLALGAYGTNDPVRQARFRQAEKIAKIFGTELRAVAPRNGAAASYYNGVISIDPNVSDPVQTLLLHELTHHMERKTGYDRYASAVVDHLREKNGAEWLAGMEREIRADYRKRGVELDDPGVRKELVAKYSETLQDETFAKRLAREDPNVVQRI
ncbi:MAG: hypothetical protein IKA78_00245, partial [Oscillospiraceae bacterium]|nr:hypothetical protein [Oscillospiraceae bacterium]